MLFQKGAAASMPQKQAVVQKFSLPANTPYSTSKGRTHIVQDNSKKRKRKKKKKKGIKFPRSIKACLVWTSENRQIPVCMHEAPFSEFFTPPKDHASML